MAKQEINTVLAIGDHVRMRSRMSNEHQSYQVTSEMQVAFAREPMDGLVLSIRDISTGKLIRATTGQTDEYVVELLIDNTFNPKMASPRNAPRTAERVTAAPAWRRMRATLRDLAEKGQILSTNDADLQTESPLAKQLDGWKIIKVRSSDLSSLEQEETTEA